MTSTALRSVIASGLLFVALACAGGDGSRGASENDAARPAAREDGLPVGTDSIIAARMLRIGELDGAPEYAFGQIVAILPAPDGGFYACDQNDFVARYYDAAARFVRQVGRRGAGPAEYQHCADMAITPDSGLAINDPSNGRFVFFRAGGTFDRVVAALVGGGLGGPNSFFVDTAGRIWKKGWMPHEGVTESAIPTQYVIMDQQGHRLDSLTVPTRGEGGGRGFALCTNDGCYDAQAPDSLYWAGVDGRLAVAGTRRYLVQVRSPDGSVKEMGREQAQVPYTRDEHAEWEDWRACFAKRQPQYPPSPIPLLKPFLRGVRLDDVGRLWVQVHVPAEKRPIPPRKPGDLRPLLTWRERNTCDLFDVATGGYIGRIAFPYATEFMASRGNRVWLREEGESGEQLIGVHELRPAAR